MTDAELMGTSSLAVSLFFFFFFLLNFPPAIIVTKKMGRSDCPGMCVWLESAARLQQQEIEDFFGMREMKLFFFSGILGKLMCPEEPGVIKV